MPGMTPSETDVMAMWDAGHERPAIARELQMSESRVGCIVRTYNCDIDKVDAAHERRMYLGSIKLLSAIQLAQAQRGLV